jgi:hypothetical protein
VYLVIVYKGAASEVRRFESCSMPDRKWLLEASPAIAAPPLRLCKRDNLAFAKG